MLNRRRVMSFLHAEPSVYAQRCRQKWNDEAPGGVNRSTLKGLPMNNECCFSIPSLSPPSAPLSLLTSAFQSTPADLNHIRLKERRGRGDPGLKQTRHTPLHVIRLLSDVQASLQMSGWSFTSFCKDEWDLESHLCKNSPKVKSGCNMPLRADSGGEFLTVKSLSAF